MKNHIDCNIAITYHAVPKKPGMPLVTTFVQKMAEQSMLQNRQWHLEEHVILMRLSPKSVLSYLPLINISPTDITTVFTCIKGFEVTLSGNWNILVMTADAAIYKMHLPMDRTSCIEMVTVDCRPNEVLGMTFGSTCKMLAGKSTPRMGLLPDMQNCGLGMRRECQERFSRHREFAIPTCITARAWRTCRGACRDR